MERGLSGNTASNNGTNGLRLAGTLTGTSTLMETSGLPTSWRNTLIGLVPYISRLAARW